MDGVDPLYDLGFAGQFLRSLNLTLLTASGAPFCPKSTIPHILGVVPWVGIIAGRFVLLGLTVFLPLKTVYMPGTSKGIIPRVPFLRKPGRPIHRV